MERVDRFRSLPSLAVVIRYHLVLIVTSVVLALGLATLYVVNLSSSYTATAVLLLSPAPGNPLTAETASSSSLQMTIALETEKQLVSTPAVFDLVSAEVGRPVPGPDESLGVSVPSNTQMLKVSFTSTTPERAREGARGFADGYLSYRAQRAQAVQEARMDRLKEQISATEETLREAIAAGNSAYASQEVQLSVDRLASLNSSLSSTELVSTYPGAVTSAPTLPETSDRLPSWSVLVAAAVLGFLVGVGLALLREWRRDLIRNADVGAELGVPVFATIHPQCRGGLATEAGPEAHESYRQLRTAVIANAPRPYTLAVTAVGVESGGEGSALSAEVAANLAVVLAEAKLNVLLITTSSEHQPVEELLGVIVEEGLTDVVAGGVSACDSLATAHGISVLTVGPEVDGFPDLTATSGFGSVVEELRQHFDYIILAAAAAGSSDGDSVLLVADSALLVLTPDKTTRNLLSVILDRMQQLGVEALGAARVGPDRGRRVGQRDRDHRHGPAPEASSVQGDSSEADLVRATY